MITNSLRLGNYIQEEVLGYVKVSGIEEGYVTVDVKGMEDNGEIVIDKWRFSVKEIKGIELTVEILEKAGFRGETERKRHFVLNLTSAAYLIFYVKSGMIVQMQLYNDGYCEHFHATPPKYLHTLQNLIHSLTSEELKIEL